MTVLETERLVLRRLTLDDAEFIFRLVNEPSWLRFIGDKGVKTLDDARDYIRTGPIASYERLGFGLYLAELKGSGRPIGMCGLLKRDALEHPDIGFALLPEFWGQGYAYESAAAVMAFGKDVLGLDRILAVTNPDNYSSMRLLEKLGLRADGAVTLSDEGPELRVFTTG
jgi:RimJ/RimL family protein N-acetyltransferase